MKCSSQFPLDNVQKPRCICIVNTWHRSALDKFCRHICGNVCTYHWYSMDTISVCILYDKYIITNISYMRIFYIWICGTYNKTKLIKLTIIYMMKTLGLIYLWLIAHREQFKSDKSHGPGEQNPSETSPTTVKNLANSSIACCIGFTSLLHKSLDGRNHSFS